MTFRRLAVAVLLSSVCLAASALPGHAVLTDGRYKGPFDPLSDPNPSQGPSIFGIADAPYGANKNGGGSAFGNYDGGQTFGGGPVGYWALTTDPGTFQMTLAFGPKYEFPRKFHFVLDNGAKFVLVRNVPEYYPGAGDYYKFPGGTFAQQFQALGPCVTSVAVHIPNGGTTKVAVTIHDGDVNGPQIGPVRYLEGGFANFAMACWSAGEVPTTPGHYYTAKFHEEDYLPLQLYFSAARCLVGSQYYGGKAWKDGVEQPNPLEMVLGMDTDGISTTLNTSEAESERSLNPITPGVAGQTFTATGTSVIGGDFRIEGNYYDDWLGARTYADVEVAVFESPGVDGLGVNQIGPTRLVKTKQGSFGRTVFTWAPGDVPVVPGQSYYIRYTLEPGFPTGFFSLYTTNSNEYSGGDFYYGGLQQNYDLAGSIWCEASPGSATMPKLEITNKAGQEFSSPQCTQRLTTSAKIEWATPVVASTGKVEYAENNPPYTSSVLDTSTSTTHSVILTGLKPGTEYHCRITASAPGYRDGMSRDFAFVTIPESPNLLVNPDFESGNLNGWTRYGRQLPGIRNYAALGGGFIGGVKAHGGNYYVGNEHNSCCTNPSGLGGVWQRVAVIPGQAVTFRGWLYTYQGDPNVAEFDKGVDEMVTGRFGIDPTGGTDPGSPNIVWSIPSSGQDWYDPNARTKYVDFSVTTTPSSDHVTVYAEAGQLQVTVNPPRAIGWNVYGMDDFSLSQSITPQLLAHLGEAAALPDGTLVTSNNVIVTAVASEIGANYVEDPNRSYGIRVDAATEPQRGDSVTVTGTLATRPSGERYLASASFTNATSSTEPVSLGAKNQSVSGYGLSTVGLLMRTWGKVQSVGAGFIMLTDGSPAALKVDTTAAGGTYNVGEFYEVTGVVSLEGTSPANSEAVLHPRWPLDFVSP